MKGAKIKNGLKVANIVKKSNEKRQNRLKVAKFDNSGTQEKETCRKFGVKGVKEWKKCVKQAKGGKNQNGLKVAKIKQK